MTPDDLMTIGIAILGVLAVVGMFFHTRMINYLKSEHFELWKLLGEQHLVTNNTMSNSFSVQGFIWKKKYLEANDPELTKRCDQLRYLQIIYIPVFLLLLILFFTFIIF